MSDLRLSVLDQTPISEGSTGAEVIGNTLDLARRCDELGYRRYWLAEHHGTPMLACASPEALIGPVARETSSIRVGSGGVMLPHYSPLKVAETFSILAALAPGRIDLALGRAPGTDQLTALALQRDRRQPAPDDFPQQLVELLALLEDRLPSDHPFARLAGVLPGLPERPEPWLLGSSPQSAVWAAELGLPYSFADFINPQGPAIVADYRARFEPAGRAEAPTVAVGVVALCAETDAEAERLATSHKMAFALLRRGRLIKVPPVDQAVRYWAERRASGDGHRSRRRTIVGAPATVRAGIEQAAREYGAEEVVILTIAYEHEARRRSYELIANEFALGGQPAAADATGTG